MARLLFFIVVTSWCGCLQVPPLPDVVDMTGDPDQGSRDTASNDTSHDMTADRDVSPDASRDAGPDGDMPVNVDDVSLACGPAHACAIRAGLLRCWGNNDARQIVSEPAEVLPAHETAIGDEPVRAVALGRQHTCVVTADGFSVKCWGTNGSQQVTPNSAPAAGEVVVPFQISAEIAAIAASDTYTCVSDGSRVSCWGGDFAGIEEQLPEMVDALSASGDATCAVTADSDELSCWGDPVLGNGNNNDVRTRTYRMGGLIAVGVGGEHACALTNDGEALCFGSDEYGQKDPAPPNTGLNTEPDIVRGEVADLAVGAAHTCVIDSVGVVHCWGRNNAGETGATMLAPTGGSEGSVDAPNSRRFVQACAGVDYTCAVDDLARVFCWGDLFTLLNGTSSERPFLVTDLEDAL